MTLSTEHEALTDAFLEAITGTWEGSLRWKYPGPTGPRGFSALVSPSMADPILGLCVPGRKGPVAADAYVFAFDGADVILVEVGRMPEGRWSFLLASDGNPVRVLRIGFDRNVWLLHPRSTQFEKDLLASVEARMAMSDLRPLPRPPRAVLDRLFQECAAYYINWGLEPEGEQ
jgi:hypothetical protein